MNMFHLMSTTRCFVNKPRFNLYSCNHFVLQENNWDITFLREGTFLIFGKGVVFVVLSSLIQERDLAMISLSGIIKN